MAHVKYPRTPHLPWSLGIRSDDKVTDNVSELEGRRVIVTEKLDGENTTMYRDFIHARSLDSRGGVDRDWVKQLWARISHEIDEGWRICGENVWAVHSIKYDDLLSYFYGFSVWDDKNVCLSWEDTVTYLEVLGIKHVPVLYDGLFSVNELKRIEKSSDWNEKEGYVVRLADSFPYAQFKRSVVKFVRADHVRTDQHWRARALVANKLRTDA